MQLWTLLLLLPGQAIESADFPKPLQMKAVTASVRVVNRTQRVEGSGTVVGKKDSAVYVLTAAHLGKPSDEWEVSTYSLSSYPSPSAIITKAEMIARTRDIRDLAILRVQVEKPGPEMLPLCPLSQLPAGKDFECLSVGVGEGRAPLCLLETVEQDKVARRPPARDTARFWQTSSEQSPGRSGGALFDRQGRIIGVASGTSEGKGYYIHAMEIQRWLKAKGLAFLVSDDEKKEKSPAEKP